MRVWFVNPLVDLLHLSTFVYQRTITIKRSSLLHQHYFLHDPFFSLVFFINMNRYLFYVSRSGSEW